MSGSGRRGSRALGARVAILGAALVAALTLAPAAQAAVNLTPIPNLPDVSVGDSANGTLEITNNSSGADAMGSMTLSAVKLTPACAFNFVYPCFGTDRDPGVFALDPTASGQAGTACAGTTFTVTENDPTTGEYTFTPPSPVILGPPPSACTIAFSFSVLKLPTRDAAPPDPGVQTFSIGRATGTVGAATGTGHGFDITTVSLDTPTLALTAGPYNPNQPISASATLSDGTTPGGSLTFNLYGPGDTTCAGPPLFTSTVPVNGNGTYASSTFTPPAPGVYRWRVAYGGDVDNNPTATPCDAPGSTVLVKQATQLTIQASPSSVRLGAPIDAFATLSGGATPTGTLTLNLYGPDDPSCSGPAVATTSLPVSANGPFVAPQAVVNRPGVYRWVATYSGDGANFSSASVCSEAAGAVAVLPISCGGKQVTLIARPGETSIVGTAGADVIASLGGAQTIRGLGGDDVICGLGRSDRLLGGAGRDRLIGGGGADILGGGGGVDSLIGGAGRDVLSGSGGNDRLLGGGGNDRFLGGAAADTLLGGPGDDILNGGPGRDRCLGGSGRNSLLSC